MDGNQYRDQRTSAARIYRRLYKTARWLRLREKRRREEPLCRMCAAQGRITPMAVVDHVEEHKGDVDLFFDFDNTQSLCKPHHDQAKQQIEVRGYSSEVGADGMPVDPDHPFHRG